MDEETNTRSWDVGKRRRWWVAHYAKVVGGFVAALVALGTAMSSVGLRFDLQTRTESRAEHKELVDQLRAENRSALDRVEGALSRLSDRIDAALLAESRGPGRSRPR